MGKRLRLRTVHADRHASCWIVGCICRWLALSASAMRCCLGLMGIRYWLTYACPAWLRTPLLVRHSRVRRIQTIITKCFTYQFGTYAAFKSYTSLWHRFAAGVLDKLEILHSPQPVHQVAHPTLVQHTNKLTSNAAKLDSSDFARRQSSPAALYFRTNIAAAEPKLRIASPPSTRTDFEVLEAVRSGRRSFDASLAVCAAGLQGSESETVAAARRGGPADLPSKAGDHLGVAASDAASTSPSRAGETPFEMAALSSPFSSSGSSSAGGSSMTPAISDPQSSSEDQKPAEEPSAAAQPAAAPAFGFASAFKSPFEVCRSFPCDLRVHVHDALAP